MITGRRAVHRTFFYSAGLAIVLSGPLAAVLVLWRWTAMDHPLTPSLSPAMWSARAFLRDFDALVLLTWVPCAVLTSRMIARWQRRTDA